MNSFRKYRSDYLFSAPSFSIGAGSVFNIAGNYFQFNYSHSDVEADAKAILSDWGVVGNDLLEAKEELERRVANSL